MKLLYYVPSDTADDLKRLLNKILEEIEPTKNTEKIKMMVTIAEPKYSEYTLRESIQTLKGLETLADNNAYDIEFYPNHDGKLYEMRFSRDVSEGFPPVMKKETCVIQFEGILINSDFDDMAILINMEQKTKAMNLTLCFPRDKFEAYLRREVIEGNPETDAEYLKEKGIF